MVVDCPWLQSSQPVGPSVIEGLDVAGKAVLFHTAGTGFGGQPDYFRHPFLAGETARVLAERGAKLAGVGFLIVDDPNDPRRPVHVTLLRNNILIGENLAGLSALPEEGFTFHAAPVKYAGAAAFRCALMQFCHSNGW